MSMTIRQMEAALEPFGGHLSGEQIASLRRYLDILIRWNETVSLTSVTEPEEIAARHFGESIFALTSVDMTHGRLADVGSGAGFPGLPLKIASPALEVVLIEPNAKKCAFLTEICGSLAVPGVVISRSRYEEYGRESTRFDFIVSRALGDYKRLLQWATNSLNQQGVVALWLGTDDALLVGRYSGWIWDPPVPIPGSRRRVILFGRPKR